MDIEGDAQFRWIDIPVDLFKGYRQLRSEGERLSIAVKYIINSRVHEILTVDNNSQDKIWTNEETVEAGPRGDFERLEDHNFGGEENEEVHCFGH